MRSAICLVIVKAPLGKSRYDCANLQLRRHACYHAIKPVCSDRATIVHLWRGSARNNDVVLFMRAGGLRVDWRERYQGPLLREPFFPALLSMGAEI
jgi:hypothetical protein